MIAKRSKTWRRRRWLGVVAFLLAALVIAANVPAWAAPDRAPHNQTVPQPTATSKPSDLPTATPDTGDSDDDDDDDDDSDDDSTSQPEPTETPEPIPAPVEPSVDGNEDTSFGGALITGEIVVVRLNVRAGPGTDFEIIGTMGNGDTVTLLGRSADGTWWAICCVGEQGSPGWVSAQFVKPNVGRAEANNALPVVAGLDDLLTATDPPPTASDQVPESAAAESATTDLLLEITQSPPHVLQGEQVDLTLVVTNVGEEEAQAIVLSDQLPDGLTFVSAEIDADGLTSQKSGEGGAVVVLAEWPELAAGASARAVLTLEVAADHPGGSVIDNLVAVNADNAGGATAGVSIGTAPTLLPDF